MYDEEIVHTIQGLIEACGGKTDSFEADLVMQMIQNSLKLISEGHDAGKLKLMTRVMKEMRYAYRVFNQYSVSKCISIFGSARTPENHPDYLSAKHFSQGMNKLGWMCITGAANGIMKAGFEGSQPSSTFGLSIRLPFEAPANALIEGDPKLIIFRYFFTRKLMFLSHSHAVAVYPGGFGTLDELFEVLTLMQTGKTTIVPIVLLEGTNGIYWKHWEHYLHEHLLKNGWIGPEDQHFYYLANTEEEAIQHILRFYKRFHSYRYVKDELVIRMLGPLTPEQILELNSGFSTLIEVGEMKMVPPFPEETDFLELPRLAFKHTKKTFGLLRALIDRINSFDGPVSA